MVVEQVGILAGGWKDGCGVSGNIGWWMEGWLWSKWEYWLVDGRMVVKPWEYWLVDGRMVVEQVGILTGGLKDGCGASGNILLLQLFIRAKRRSYILKIFYVQYETIR
jgi:hypothetical protein